MTLKEALEEYKSVYMAYRNFADRTRIEYANDLDDLVTYLRSIKVMKVGELRLGQIEHYLAHLEKVIEYTKIKVPVLVGVSHNEVEKSVSLAKHAEGVNADAILILLNQGEKSYS